MIVSSIFKVRAPTAVSPQLVFIYCKRNIMISGYIILQSNLNLIQAWPQNQRSLETLPGSVWESSCYISINIALQSNLNLIQAWSQNQRGLKTFPGSVWESSCHMKYLKLRLGIWLGSTHSQQAFSGL